MKVLLREERAVEPVTLQGCMLIVSCMHELDLARRMGETSFAVLSGRCFSQYRDG